MSENESFFREVDEDYRRDQLAEIWKNYGIYLIAAAFVIAAIVGGYAIQRDRAAKRAASGGDAFIGALTLADEGKVDEANKAFALMGDTQSSAYKVLAQLHLAAESVAKKQMTEAAEHYRIVSTDDTAPKELRDFATIQLAALSVDKDNYDTLTQKIGNLRGGTSEWRFAATDILGMAAMKDGKTADAERLFGEILSDGGAPKGMRDRAEIMLALLVEKNKTASRPVAPKTDTVNDAKTQ